MVVTEPERHSLGITGTEPNHDSFFALLGSRKQRDSEILAAFSAEEQKTIRYRQKVLSSLTYFIGKDFSIPIELNEPGMGWSWNFRENRVNADPKDLVEKPLDYLRFVFSHEGSHRRISRAETTPFDVWKQPGFSFMANALEDPRVNNFLIDAYPKSRGQIQVAYELDAQFEAQMKEKAKDKLGFQPRSVRAGFEYMDQWFKEIQDQPMELSPDLAPEVKEVVGKTLEYARDVWWHYPSKQEANQGEGLIKQYARIVSEIEQDKIWPEFRKLVDQDIEDAKAQQLLQQILQNGGEKGGAIPQDLKEKLSEQEQQELSGALEENEKKSKKEEPGQKDREGAAIDLDSLSQNLKDKLKDYLDNLPAPTKEQLEEMAREVMKELEEMLNEMLQGRLSENPERIKEKSEDQDSRIQAPINKEGMDKEDKPGPSSPEDYEKSEEFRSFKEKIKHLTETSQNIYEAKRKEVLPIIDALEQDLRELFVERRSTNWHGGYRVGKRIDIQKRMQEKARDITPVESRAWEKRELPKEKDYAITLLVDLSGSMKHEKIEETFKGLVVLAEVLNRLSIKTEILGFNDKIYEYQIYGQDMSKAVRENMGNMISEVRSSGAAWNDDGWALEQASERLGRQKATEKFLFVLSDGLPVPSSSHSSPNYELSRVVQRIMKETDQKLIGLGIGPGTEHVSVYYPNSIASIMVNELPSKLADVIREAISGYNKF